MGKQTGKKGIDPKKVMLTALGVGAVGTLAFFAISKATSSGNSESNVPDSSMDASPKKRIFKKRKTLPVSTETNTSLPTIREDVPSEPFVPQDLAKSLMESGTGKNLLQVLSVLRKMKNTSDYWLVNEKYKHLRYWGNKTIVTDLLEEDFKEDENAKALIRKEFLRMGLRQDSSTQKWSLSGFRMYNDIITIKPTYVLDSMGNRIAVRKNTILGEEINIANGMTWFKDIHGSIHSVPAKDVRYQ